MVENESMVELGCPETATWQCLTLVLPYSPQQRRCKLN